MKKYKLIVAILMIAILCIGASGCMNKRKNLNRKETDTEYLVLMQNYLEDKYNKDFELVEHILPEGGFNTGLEYNVGIFKDTDGILANVKAQLGTPYEFFDYYVEFCAASLIKNDIDTAEIDKYGSSKFYVVLNNNDINNIDISAENIGKLTYVANIKQEPNDEILNALYYVYEQICDMKYSSFYLIVGFTEESDTFSKVVENYHIYGKQKWENHSGIVYATMKITEEKLNFDEFKEKLIKI